jgi:hypothetical protein
MKSPNGLYFFFCDIFPFYDHTRCDLRAFWCITSTSHSYMRKYSVSRIFHQYKRTRVSKKKTRVHSATLFFYFFRIAAIFFLVSLKKNRKEEKKFCIFFLFGVESNHFRAKNKNFLSTPKKNMHIFFTFTIFFLFFDFFFFESKDVIFFSFFFRVERKNFFYAVGMAG